MGRRPARTRDQLPPPPLGDTVTVAILSAELQAVDVAEAPPHLLVATAPATPQRRVLGTISIAVDAELLELIVAHPGRFADALERRVRSLAADLVADMQQQPED